VRGVALSPGTRPGGVPPLNISPSKGSLKGTRWMRAALVTSSPIDGPGGGAPPEALRPQIGRLFTRRVQFARTAPVRSTSRTIATMWRCWIRSIPPSSQRNYGLVWINLTAMNRAID
jgi:hypothetical protein